MQVIYLSINISVIKHSYEWGLRVCGFAVSAIFNLLFRFIEKNIAFFSICVFSGFRFHSFFDSVFRFIEKNIAFFSICVFYGLQFLHFSPDFCSFSSSVHKKTMRPGNYGNGKLCI